MKGLPFFLTITLSLFFFACGDDKSVSSSDSSSSSEEEIDGGGVEEESSSSIKPESSSSVIDASDLKGVLIDDFEDGDEESFLGTSWYAYDDHDNGAESEYAMAVTTEGYLSSKSLRVDYDLKKGDYEYDPYIGWGISIPVLKNIESLGGVSYWYKGGAHYLRVETSDVTDYDVHLVKVAASRVWKQASIRFADLAQEGWGVSVPFEKKNISAISWQVKGNGKADSLLIDYVYLMDASEVPPDVADMTIRDPLIPTVEIGDIAISNPLQEKAMKYLNKGINFTNWLEEARPFDGTFQFDESDVKLLAQNGIKSLRFPIDLDLYATNRDDFIAGKADALKFDDKSLFTVLDSFVEWTARHGISFVIDYHEYDNSYNVKSAEDDGYIQMMANVWKHVAAHYADNPREDLFFELLNEPDMSDGKVSSASWTRAAQAMIDSIRSVDKNHTIIFGDAAWYSISNLSKRTPFEDDNIIYAVHTYEPFVFTHQGASWGETATIKNLPFPYAPEKWSEYSADFGVTKSTASWVKTAVKNYYKTGSKEYILSLVLPAKEWAVKNNVPVIINEFGAYNLKSDSESILNYMKAMREVGDTLQIPLQHWGYTGGFSLFEGGALIKGMKEAFGL